MVIFPIPGQAPAAPANDAAPAPTLDAGTTLQLQATVLSHARFSAAASAFCTEAAALLRFDRVSIGFMERGYATVAAVSRLGEFRAGSELARRLAEAMDEALAQRDTVRHPAEPGARPRVNAAQAELVRRDGGSAVSVILLSDGAAIGALTLQRFGTPITREEIARIEHLGCFIGPILDLKRRDERSWLRRLEQRARDAWRRLREPGRGTFRAALAGAIAAVAGLLFFPVPYHVGAPARLEGAVQRVVVAPTDGFLRQAHVRPGDAVEAGQLLIELADQDLTVERRRRAAELAQHESAYMAAMARSDRTQYAVSYAKASEVRAHLDLIDERLARSRIEAPLAGVIIKGDLARSLGAPVQRGEVLLTLAAGDEFRLIVDVDERDIAQLGAGQRGELALAALPDRTFAFSVERVTPVSTARDGRNYFEVTGVLEEAASATLRPGFEGVAKIRVADRPYAWIWTHRLVESLRIAFWSWGA